MRLLHRLSGALLLLLALGVSAALVWAAAKAETWAIVMERLPRERISAFGVAGALFCLVLLYLLTAKRAPRYRETFITFETEAGTVNVSTRAIAGIINRVADEFAAIQGLEATVRPAGGGLEVSLDVRVRGGTQLAELGRLLQNRVQEIIRDNLGLAEIRGINVAIREILAPAPARTPETSA